MHDWNKCDHIIKSIRSSNWKCNSQKKKWTKEAIKNSRWLFFKIKNMTNIDILKEIKSENCKNDKKKRNNKKSDNEKKSKDDISNVKLLIWRIWDHLNMQTFLLTRRSTIFYEEAWFTIQIVMIHIFMIWINS
jgi:hypothetical protein